MVKLAMMEVLDRLIKSGLSEDDAALLVDLYIKFQFHINYALPLKMLHISTFL